MKKILTLFIPLLLAIFLLSGCAALHSGIMSDSASLSSANFKILSNAKGTAKTTIVLGFGGLKKDALAAEAKADLLRNNPLRENQTLANATTDFKVTMYLGVVMVTKATVTADIVEFR